MKMYRGIIATAMVIGACSMASLAQVSVGSDDFESYPLGAWAEGTVFGGVGSAIADSGTDRAQELQVDINMDAQWNSGVNFNLDTTGNVSRQITDYELEFYFHVDPATLPSLSVPGGNGNTPEFILNLYNPDAPNQSTEFKIGEVTNYGDAVTNGAVLRCRFNPDDVYIKWDKNAHIDADIPVWRVELSYGFGGSTGTNGSQPILMIVDDLVARYIAPPMVNPEGSPVGDVFTNDVTISGTVYDGSSEVEVMELLLDGAIVNVTSNNLGGSITNVITYDVMDIAGGAHTAIVKAYDTGTNVVSYSWDFNVVSMIIPEGAGTPTGATAEDVTLTGTILDGAYEVDVMELYIDGSVVNVTSNHMGGSSTNVITYDAVGLAEGSHAATVKAYDASGSNSVSHIWSFYVTAGVIPPASDIVGLYNVNIYSTAGNAHPDFKPYLVTDGTVAAAPSLGTNTWGNWNWDNLYYWGNTTISGVQAGTPDLPAMTCQLIPSTGVNGSFHCWWSWDQPEWNETKTAFYTTVTTNSSMMWGHAAGGDGQELEIRDLDSSFSYDLYLYFVSSSSMEVVPAIYTLTQGFAPITSNALDSVQSSVWSGDAIVHDFVEGENYTVITDVSPVDDKIAVKIHSGGLSAFQLAVRRPSASVEPNLRSIKSAGGGMVDLTWESENFITYNVLGKSDLINGGAWSSVTNGIPSGGTNTTFTVPMSGDLEFFSIEGE